MNKSLSLHSQHTTVTGIYPPLASFPLPQQFQSFSQYRCKTAKKSEEEIDFLRSNPKIWNVHSVLNVLHSLVDKSNINRQLEVYTSGGECGRQGRAGLPEIFVFNCSAVSPGPSFVLIPPKLSVGNSLCVKKTLLCVYVCMMIYMGTHMQKSVLSSITWILEIKSKLLAYFTAGALTS